MYIHVNRPSNPRFLARVRRPGYRKYELVGKPRKSKKAAMLALIDKFSEDEYKRGDVLMIQDGYYGPSVMCEITR